MVRTPSFDSNGMKKGAWSEEEDNILRAYVQRFGHPNWRLLPLLAGLTRCGKSCRLRWVNYLKPGMKRGNFSKEEEDLIIKLHALLGNKWSDIAKKLPGRTDNDIKNYWHAHIQKRGKRSRGVTRAISADQMGHEEQSSELSSCITTDHHQEETSFNDVFAWDLPAENPENINAVSPIGDSYLVEQDQGNLWTESYYDQTCFSIDLPPFPEEEFFDFGLCQNDMSTFSDSSDGGITHSWSSSPTESQGNFWSEQFGEEAFNVVLWS